MLSEGRKGLSERASRKTGISSCETLETVREPSEGLMVGCMMVVNLVDKLSNQVETNVHQTYTKHTPNGQQTDSKNGQEETEAEDMTIREVAERAGLSHQAIYKRLKAKGIHVSSLKDKDSGQLNEEGERILRELFSIQAENQAPDGATRETVRPSVESEVDRLRKEVERLTTEVVTLRNKVDALEEKNKALTEERDFLRVSLERSQQLQMVTASKIPNPPPLLPASGSSADNSSKGLISGVRSWWARRRELKREPAGAHEQEDQTE